MSLGFDEPARVREIAGDLGKNLQVLSRLTGAGIGQRGDQLHLSGEEEQVALAERVLRELYALSVMGLSIETPVVQQGCRLLMKNPEVSLTEVFGEVVFVGHRKRPIFPRSLNQRSYIHKIRESSLVFGVGPAGTGKTYLAVAMAAAALENREVRRIILCRPAVEAGEKLGFLPGTLEDKVDPYLRPLYDALYDMLSYDKVQRLIQRNVIEVVPLAFMRGRTLSEAFVILDEGQNTSCEQMKMFLTRMGVGSKMVVTGDVTQVDLPDGQRSGLVDARELLERVRGVGVTDFDSSDVVRHPLVARIIDAYDQRARSS